MALIGAKISMMEFFIGEREKNGQIKGMISRRRLILFYTIQAIPNIYTKFQILDIVVPEKSLMKKKFTHTQTNTHTQLLKRQKLYTPYIRCMPGV